MDIAVSALPPIDNRNIRSVLSGRYPPNGLCAVPGCDQPAGSQHHIFGRPPGDDPSSWFVVVHERSEWKGPIEGQFYGDPIPHVVGLCGSGTTGHHGDVEEHRAWIKLEDGVFVWYQRVLAEHAREPDETIWERVGPLDPQPCAGEKRDKPKRKRKAGEERRKRENITVRVPKDSEDGAGIYDETLERVKEKLVRMELYGPNDKIPAYEATIAAWNDWLTD